MTAPSTSTEAGPRRARVPTLRRPDVVVALAVYAMTRVFAWVVITRAAARQLPSVWTPQHSGYLDMATLWDAQWYRIIATQGYPVPLPVDAAGAVQQNAWAFFPGFPFLVKAVMAATGLSFSYVTNGIDRHVIRQWRRNIGLNSRAAAVGLPPKQV